MAAASFFLQLELTRRIFRSEAAARLGVLLLTIYPNHVGYTAFTLTEIYFTFLLLLGIYIYLARRGWTWVLLSGLVFGLAALTKPQVIFLPGLLVLLELLSRGKKPGLRDDIAKGFVIYLMMAMVLVPWAVRNSQVFGETVLISTNGGATLLTGNNPSADGSYAENDPLVAQRNFSVRDQVEADRRAQALALNWIKENPGRFVQLIPLKDMALVGERWGDRVGLSVGLSQVRAISRYFSVGKMGKSDFLQPVTDRLARRSRFASKKWP